MYFDFLTWFSDNPLVIFIGSVGLLLMTFLAVKSILDWIRDSRKKPDLIFKPSILEESIEKREDIFYTKVNFWINVTNKGSKEANNCHVFLK